ncbi:MAG: DNA polymerase III subunit alpha, partial [Armatimonadetes bacterium]|nr:DNA polymerase III subunit alpha [Armatimonadota bacterium]
GIRRYLKELRPSRIQDIMAMVALFRPGPMQNIPAYIRRKHGLEAITYPHPLLEGVLGETHGVLVYQEDVMAAVQALAGYTMAEADVFCYAIRKKIKDLLQQQRTKFLEGCKKRGITKKVADQIFELFEPFARYGFNRAHAATYGLIAYYTAYLKANYSREYMAAVLTSEAGNPDKVAMAVAECQRMGIRVLPPDINESRDGFTVVEEGIRFGLAAVKNVGAGAVEAIVEARNNGGPFRGPSDLCARVDSRVVNKRVLESLVKAGAFDSLGRSRAEMLQTLDEALEVGQRAQRSQASGQTGLFDLGAAAPPEEERRAEHAVEEFSREELLMMEKEMLGLYISDHPLNHWRDALARRVTAPLANLLDLPDRAEVTVGGIVTALKRTTTRSGQAMGFLTLEDFSGSVEVIVFPKTYEQAHYLLKRDAVVLIKGRVDIQEQQAKVLADQVTALADLEAAAAWSGAGAPGNHAAAPGNHRAPARNGRPLRIRIFTAEELEQLHHVLAPQRGTQEVFVHVVTATGEEQVVSTGFRVNGGDALRAELEQLFGEDNVWEA